MELRDFVMIFWRQRRVLVVIVVVSGVLGWFAWVSQPSSVVADLTLNIARTGVQQTVDYRYDGFYRLQADERFADTVVQWLGSPRIVEDIAMRAVARPMNTQPWQFGSPVQAERLSSQVIRVTYRTQTAEEAKRFVQSLLIVINQETSQLNSTAKDESWFIVQGGEPVITDGRFGVVKALAIAVALGLFVAFWTGLFRYYWKKR